MRLITGATCAVVMVACCACQPAGTPVDSYRVVHVYPHDPAAFTQGLAFHDGYLYEGTGMEGRSVVRRVRLETGEVLQEVPLDRQHFGEGIAIAGDKVIQLRNNYQKLVFNGDTGVITDIDLENQEVRVRFDDEVVFDYTDLNELALGYSISVHRAQGSEYPATVIPLLIQHYLMLQRNLLYTALTRARGTVVLVGQRKAIGMAVRNAQVRKRYSGLAARLSTDAPAVRSR